MCANCKKNFELSYYYYLKLFKIYNLLATENGGKDRSKVNFEGDMILNDQQLLAISRKMMRNGMINTTLRWPNKIVPFELSSNITKLQQNYIRLALDTIESKSCIKFVQHTNEEGYVYVTVIYSFFNYLGNA